MSLIAVVAIMAFMAVAIAGLLFDYAETSRRNLLADESTMLATLKAKVVEFVAKNKRLPNLTNTSEYLALSKGLTDRLGRSAIYLYSGALDSTDICSTTTSLISMRDCGADVACASPLITADVPFALILPGSAVANTLAVVSQTTLQNASAKITSAEALTRFTPGVLVGSVANRTVDTGVYDDVVMLGDFSELRKAAGCLSSSQGGIVESGASVKILNSTAALPTALIGNLYSSATAPFVAYGSAGSTYAWTAAGLPPGLRLVTNGSQAYIDSNSTPVAGPAGSYSVAVSVIATLRGNAPTSAVTKPLVVCPYSTPTGATQVVSCPVGYTGTITQAEMTETCTGTTLWVDTTNTCTLVIPAAVEAVFTAANVASAAGAIPLTRNLGVSSLTVAGVTVSSGAKYLSLNNDAIGVADIGDDNPNPTAAAVAGTETLNFNFGTARTSASIVFSALGKQNPGGTYESVSISLYSGATLVTTITRTACSVNNESTNTLVAFDDINPGSQFDNFTVTPNGGSVDFYVAGVKACTGNSCSQSLPPATVRCP